jgi:putative peptidoglycan lipid II flippase
MSEQSRQYRSMATTASWTLVSRLLGLVRDQLMAATFGAGAVASAFLLAFQVPNLFRRLLGEGALSTALIPPLAGKLEREGRPAALAFLNHVLGRVLPWMIGLSLLGMGIALGLSLLLEARGGMAAELTVWTLPYLPLICAAALVTASVQLMGRFGLAEIAAGCLNLCLIASLAWIGPTLAPQDLLTQARILCAATVLGGAIQLAIPLMGLRRLGWRSRPSTPDARAWGELKATFLPALIGAGVLQLNLLISRLVAFGLDDAALTYYHVANRVTELPVGLFSVSIATVIFPALALAQAQGDKEALGRNYARGARLIIAINIAAAFGLAVFAKPVLELLFQYGRFSLLDVENSADLLVIFAAAMPLYALSALASRALTVVGRANLTLRAAVHALAVNAVLSAALAPTLGVAGLAWANLASAAWQLVVLRRSLGQAEPAYLAEGMLRPLAQVLFGSLVLATVAYQAQRYFADHLYGMMSPKPLLFVSMAIGALLGAGLYAWILNQFGYPERDILGALLRRRPRQS